jgi:sn-glycerol 3-phosphate transport system permease protein
MNSRFPNRILPYVLLSPSIVVVIVFLIIPTAQSIYTSFFRVSPFGDRRFFVGFENFSRLFESSAYLHSLIITLIFAALVVFIGLSLGTVIAVLLNQKLRGLSFYRTFFIWTYAISPAIAGTIWALMFNPSSGPIVYIIRSITGIGINWMTDRTIALVVVVIAASWKMLGYNIIFYLAGLQAIPEELLESASIDGASSVKKFFRITLPLLSPTTFFLLIMNMLYAFFDVFGLIDIMTKGGPGNATELLVYKLYRDGFLAMNTGFASAQSVVLFVFVAILTILQFKYTERKVFYG